MRDPYFGHRDWFTGEPLRDRDEWTEWDYALIAAYQLIEDLTDSHGLLRHEVESDRVFVEAVRTIDKFQAAVDRATKGSPKKGYKPQDGERWQPRLILRNGEWPTLEEYWEKLAQESEDVS